ncbi:Rieske 2Fe-2S domain-containing protein [Actinoplanes sp. TRM 88003]|uniref:Rieske 2Fe-2S domain-containing protein n=1 Tax=Paractinoplanes aksuensis TaxID=2939490 RepID=A0ABT1DZT8_9ACTN|nr:Rieske 2Fe-2S domain-containing protein [Actinoplanes aksuensis]MCO8276408.1 Rieske 2Fe-2S domain-containing protein [Actinoplanes aksuensis]
MQLFNRLETTRSFDGVIDKAQAAIIATPERLRDTLHGVWLGHALHPVLVQVPVGAFISAGILDLLPGQRRAATLLIAAGTVGVAPAAAAGWTDWSQMTKDKQRVGLVHATANVVAVGLYAASLVARLRGRPGRALSFAGLSVAGLGAYLGGHISYARGGGTNQAAPDLNRVPAEWTSVGSLASLPEGKPAVRTVGDVPVLLWRRGNTVTAMLERCSHETGPLGEGELVGTGDDACVVCPWHGSTFRLRDGVVVHGPAANDQPLLRVRVEAGQVEVAQP